MSEKQIGDVYYTEDGEKREVIDVQEEEMESGAVIRKVKSKRVEE